MMDNMIPPEAFNTDMTDTSKAVTPTDYSRYEVELWDTAKAEWEAKQGAKSE